MIGESWRIKEAIDGLGKQIGLVAQRESDGSYNFTLSESGTLCFTPADSGDRLLVSLSWVESGLESEVLWRRFRRAGFDPAMNRFLHCGLSEDGDLTYVFEFDETELDASTLESASRRLMDLRKL